MKNSFIMSVVWVAVITLVVSFGIAVFFLDDRTNIKDNNVSNRQIDEGKINEYITDESSIRTNNIINLIEVENVENTAIKEKDQKIEENNIKENESIETVSLNIDSFIQPIQGEILKPLSIDKLIYSKTLNEWNIHTGTDYKAQLGEEVFSVADGKIKEIGFNYIYGDYIVIEHDNGYESLYANITALDELNLGSVAKKGEIIGYLAESFGFEAADETHLHFELRKDKRFIGLE